MSEPDHRLYAAAAQRNRQPILEVLLQRLPRRGHVLEIASGTGEHVTHFARATPDLTWQPSELDPRGRRSIASHVSAAGLDNVLPPMDLDVTWASWPTPPCDAILCINMVHISPWAATEGLMAGAARHLMPGGLLFLYGPFRRNGTHTAPSNAAFDQSLRARNSQWGVRDIDDIEELAQGQGLSQPTLVDMPANNFSVWLEKT